MHSLWYYLAIGSFAVLWTIACIAFIDWISKPPSGKRARTRAPSLGDKALRFRPEELGWKLISNSDGFYLFEAPDGNLYATGNPHALVDVGLTT
jgi:hypothetical protein